MKYAVGKAILAKSLNNNDVLALVAGEQKIAKLAAAMKNNAAVTADDRTQLTGMLNDTDRVIYPKAASPEAAQSNPAVNKALLAKLSGGDFTQQDAQELCGQMHRVYQLKLCLGQDMGLSAADRAKLVAEYDMLNAILHQ